MRILVTGTAGFIGFHLARRFLDEGHEVAGIDGLTLYYDVALKRQRLAILQGSPGFRPFEFMLEDAGAILEVFAEVRPELVVHLAPQGGGALLHREPARLHLLQRRRQLQHPGSLPRPSRRHLMLASTSSGLRRQREDAVRRKPTSDSSITLYAPTKGAAELMAHSYAHLFDQPTTAFRFFVNRRGIRTPFWGDRGPKRDPSDAEGSQCLRDVSEVEFGMLVVETIAKIRRGALCSREVDQGDLPGAECVRKVVRKVLRTQRRRSATSVCPAHAQAGDMDAGTRPDVGSHEACPSRRASDVDPEFEELRGLGYEGGYDAVRRYARGWQREQSAVTASAFVPLSFDPARPTSSTGATRSC